MPGRPEEGAATQPMDPLFSTEIKYVLIAIYFYARIEKLGNVIPEEDKGSPEYMMIVLDIQQKADYCCFFERTSLKRKM